jgi:dUTP pyrophosphatase
MKIEFKVLETMAVVPSKATAGAAGYDLSCLENVVLKPYETQKVRTGIAININDATVAALILPRSGLGSKGIILANSVGLIDSDYQGELIVNLWNRKNQEYKFVSGERIAQLIFVPIVATELHFVEDFSTVTERGVSGFGSTGTH